MTEFVSLSCLNALQKSFTLPLVFAVSLMIPVADASSQCRSFEHSQCRSFEQMDKEAKKRLFSGKNVIVFRHAEKGGTPPQGLKCEQRDQVLSENGREQAREIGSAIKSLKIPIGKVHASPRCRTLETANLAFDRAEPKNNLRGGNNVCLSEILAEMFPTKELDRNLVLITHSDQDKLGGISGFNERMAQCQKKSKGCAEAAVFEMRAGQPACVAWIQWNQWKLLK